MFTIKQWFELVDNARLRDHLISKLYERSGGNRFHMNRKVPDFKTALNYGFHWSSNISYYRNLYDNPPKLRLGLFFRLKCFIKQL